LASPSAACIEGLVLKDPRAPLRLCASASANACAQAKCRRLTNVLSF